MKVAATEAPSPPRGAVAKTATNRGTELDAGDAGIAVLDPSTGEPIR